MVILVYTLFFMSAILIFLGKGIADIVSDETNWKKSIFSKYPIDSFYGCKDNTDKRKYWKNKILSYLFSTIFVFVSDIWHFGNFLTKVGVYLSMGSIIFFDNNWIINILFILLHLLINLVGFHLTYHTLLNRR